MKKMSTKIITIGGGNSEKTLFIDQCIVDATEKKNPKLLFIPTASSDDMEYADYIKKQYVDRLGCQMKSLLLHHETHSKKQLEELISDTDIVYVGGGNTLMMMKKWRSLGIDKLLKKAWEKGTVVAGISAGSICWHESGHSDSMHYYHPDQWDYIRVRGLGFLPFIHCPHYDSQTGGKKRKEDFKRMMKKYPSQVGVACEDGVAIEYRAETFRVLTDQATKNAYRVYWKKGKYVEEKLENREEFLSIKSLNQIS